MTCGMLAIGKEKPESNIAGKKNKNVLIIACCCVWLSVEMNSPTPSIVKQVEARRNIQERDAAAERHLRTRRSRSGGSTSRSTKEISTKGIVLPRMNSAGVIGVTMICSIVPISFSRTTAMLVKSRLTRLTTITITPGTK